MAGYFEKTPELLRFGTPFAIYAQQPNSAHADSSLRPIQTVLPLSAALKQKNLLGTTRDDYQILFFAEFGKVRVPKGEGEALKKALARISPLSVSERPEIPSVPANWRWVAALHRELARQSVNGTYFLGCRDTAKAHPSLNKDSANNINRALALPCFMKQYRQTSDEHAD